MCVEIRSPLQLITVGCNSTIERCKISKYIFPSYFADILLTYQTFVTNLHLPRAELSCKLQEKLHHVTGPLIFGEISLIPNV